MFVTENDKGALLSTISAKIMGHDDNETMELQRTNELVELTRGLPDADDKHGMAAVCFDDASSGSRLCDGDKTTSLGQ